MGTKKRVLLIGAGPTSSLISYNIAKNKRLKETVDVQVWEKASFIGGRFLTWRSPKNSYCYADLGAQYLTYSHTNPFSKQYFDNLQQHNLIRRLFTKDVAGFREDPTKTHYACVDGMDSIVKHFFERGGTTNSIYLNRKVTKLSKTPANQVEVVAEESGKDIFDLVISTIPVPQLIHLESFPNLVTDKNIRENLEAVKYSCRFALGIFFDTPLQLKTSTNPLNFISNDPIIRYWSIENFKRKGNYEEPTSITMHTSIDFGSENKESDQEAIKVQLLEKAKNIIPEVVALSEDGVKVHKWEVSQVMQAYLDAPGYVEIDKNIYAAGDSFSGSGFEGCICSAEKTVSAIQAIIL